jgi:hypothetical protein
MTQETQRVLSLDLTEDELNVIVAGLGELPAKHSHNLLVNITAQVAQWKADLVAPAPHEATGYQG